MPLQTRLIQAADLVTVALDALLPRGDGAESRLTEAMRYAALGPGKRLRPFFALEAAKLFDLDEQPVLRAACALECIHAYSLIHDDLPCMDDDDLRRGRPTVHKAYDEATAVLAGDALQAVAFEILAHADTHKDAAIRVELIRRLAIASGAQGMCGGQMMDILGVLPGTTDPNRVIVISGHYDSRVTDAKNFTSDAPGANDDGSGTAAVIEAARVLCKRQFPATLVFAVLSVFVNERVWQGIPAADRKILEDTMMEVGRKTLDWDRETAAKYRKDLEAKGMVFVEAKDGLDVEAFRKAVLVQWDHGPAAALSSAAARNDSRPPTPRCPKYAAMIEPPETAVTSATRSISGLPPGSFMSRSCCRTRAAGSGAAGSISTCSGWPRSSSKSPLLRSANTPRFPAPVAGMSHSPRCP